VFFYPIKTGGYSYFKGKWRDDSVLAWLNDQGQKRGFGDITSSCIQAAVLPGKTRLIFRAYQDIAPI